jgi:pyroglutamyl-peptidase
MRRLLVCGFGPFPAAPQNPSAAVTTRLQVAGWSPPRVEVAYAVLPTVWAEAAPLALAEAQAFDADGVLLVGVAAKAQAFRIETLARNRASAATDAAGEPGADGPITEDGDAVLPIPFDALELASAVSATGLPVELSTDAGDYLCNHTLYRLLSAGRPTAFLHVPMARECDPGADFDLAEIETAVRAAVAALAAQV